MDQIRALLPKNTFRWTITGLFLLAAVAINSLLIQRSPVVNAASTANFNAGNIISDVVFTNSGSMNVGQIQTFLASKVPTCDTNGTQPSEMNNTNVPDYNSDGVIERWEWGKYHYNQTTFTCLKDYSENGLSAAQIIYNAAQTYQVNPQVLIVLLQKEQGLVTDTWPVNIEYQSATGYGCPDSTPSVCNSNYYGFTNQINNAAYMFHAILTSNPNWYSPYTLGNNYIQWNPNSSCGGSTVNIQNLSTVALYDYTPYQPNQAALNAGYGSGDGCSSYGNRNFYLYFNDWFGSTNLLYGATYVGQANNPTLTPGQSTTLYITYRNSGSSTWYDNSTTPTRLATTYPVNRASDFADSSWGADRNRPASQFDTVYQTNGTAYSTNPHAVQPGESAKFAFTVTVPTNYLAGTYREHFSPVVDAGAGIMPTTPSDTWVDITVPVVNKAQYVTQSSSPQLLGGQSQSATMDFKNTSNTIWYDNITSGANNAPPTRLAVVDSTGTTNASSQFSGGQWGADNNRPTGVFSAVFGTDGTQYTTNPHRVLPGETARFTYQDQAPDNQTPGSYRDYLAPVLDGGAGIAQVSSQSGSSVVPWQDITVLNGPSMRPSASTSSLTLNPLTKQSFTFTYKNTGSTTLQQSTTTLNVISGDTSKINDASWQGNTIAYLDQSSLAPGATGTFTAQFTSNQAQAGTYNLQFAPMVSGSNIGLSNISASVNVPAPSFSATYTGQSNYPTIAQNSSQSAYFMYKNTGNIPWYDTTTATSAIKPVVLASTNPINRISQFNALFATPNRASLSFAAVYESDGTTLAQNQHIAQPGQIVKFSFSFYAPQTTAPGTYREMFQPIIEGGSPWDMGGEVFLDVTVTSAAYSATYVGQSNYPTIAQNSSQSAYFMYKNTGNVAWYDTTSAPNGIKPVDLASTNPINRISQFNALFATPNRPSVTFAAVYESDGVTLAQNQHIAQPGQIVKFVFSFSVPQGTTAGTYREMFQPILEGGNPWDMGGEVFLDVTVTP